MRRAVAAFFLLACAAFAANLKLYLKDGSFQLVREYSLQGDRVRFYSVERSSWEEVPADLVDLKRTEKEAADRKAAIAEEAKVLSAEDKVERALQDEVMRIPQNPGVYYLVGKEAKKIPLAETVVHNNKGRNVLKVLSPIPMVSGKATLEIATPHSLNVFDNPTPELYIQLEQAERFGILKLASAKGVRVVEKLTIMPVTKEVVEEPTEVEIFRKQLTPDGLYKIWPQNALEPGEYAVVEYTPGKMNIQVWDFGIKPAK